MTELERLVPAVWRRELEAEFAKDYFARLDGFLAEEWSRADIFPPKPQIFRALELTAPQNVKVLLLGQDPYHDHGQAHGLCFSVTDGTPLPRSLRNIFKEFESDLAEKAPDNGDLAHWAAQGVLMLNTTLTVRAHEANSHAKRGWEEFTDAIIRAVGALPSPVVFVLWGGSAQKKAELIDTGCHAVVSSAHPSPLSARRGFFGSRPFSKINALLKTSGRAEINWTAPAAGRPEQPDLFLSLGQGRG